MVKKIVREYIIKDDGNIERGSIDIESGFENEGESLSVFLINDGEGKNWCDIFE